jgi:hypothetical protein
VAHERSQRDPEGEMAIFQPGRLSCCGNYHELIYLLRGQQAEGAVTNV